MLIAAAALAACSAQSESPPPPTRGTTIAAAGLVEPSGEERVLIPEIGGRLKRVLIEEGDTVKSGQLLAEIENADYAALVSAAQAQLALREAELAKAQAGARSEERAEARAALAEAEAAVAPARSERDRRRMMFAKQQVSREALDQSGAAYEAAVARRDAAAARAALLAAGTRAEDLAIAEAGAAHARAELARARAIFEKTLIRSPVDGVVLKRDLREGETVVALSPVPLARIGDLTRLYVRADIDELDIARARVGQRATITSDAFPGKQFGGEVVRVSRRMGRRNSSSENPSDKVDTKILEAGIRLDEGAALPIGLRVDVRIGAGG